MQAFVAAGGVPAPEDPLYHETQGQPKALLEIAGKSMVQWVLDALDGARQIEKVVIVGLDESSPVNCGKIAGFVPDQGDLMLNMMAGLDRVRQLDPSAEFVLFTSADIPGLTPEMVDWRVETALQAKADLDYVAVERAVMEERFPTSNRSYVKLKDAEVCGGDINVIKASMAVRKELWDRIVAARKHPMQQAALLGFDTLLLILLRRLTFEAAERRISRKLKLDGHAHLAPYAEVAMDVDKPHQLEIMRHYMAERAAISA